MSSDAGGGGQELQVLERGGSFLAQQQGHLFPWVTVFIGCGVALWFWLPDDPGIAAYLGAGVALTGSLGLRWLTRHHDAGLHPPLILLICVALGFLAAGLRAQIVTAPVLDHRYYGPVQGRIVWIDRSQSDVIRLTLDQLVLERRAPSETPARVRVSLHGDQSHFAPFAGQTVIMTAHLAAPNGPVEPGDFDYRRMAWFERLGAVGYTRTPVLIWAPPQPGTQHVDRLRSHLAAAMLDAMPSEAGAFATGAMTGDRSAISQDTAAALRDSGLAHLLAISGMNLAFLIAFVFALIRYGFGLIAAIALRINTKKLAAVLSWGVALLYLMLSGANVATERAFIMVTVILGAVLLDRQAISLRSVALAGLILLLWKPESLLAPGFQMSFAATTALIAGFAALQMRFGPGQMPRWLYPLFALVLSSVIGGLASGPYAAATFNRFADYGLLANLLTVPVMGAVVMPAGAMAALMAPVGLAWLPLWFMEVGSAWILFIAHWVAGLDGAVTGIPSPHPLSMPLLSMGMLWLILWQGRARWAGLIPALAALVMWGGQVRPDLIIAQDGRLIGVMTAEGRVLSAARGAGFAARSWLENDGDLVDPTKAAERAGFTGPASMRSLQWQGLTISVLTGKAGLAAMTDTCATADLVVIAASLGAERAKAEAKYGCRLIDQDLLEATGAMAWRKGASGLIPQVDGGIRRWMPSSGPALPYGALAPLEPRLHSQDHSAQVRLELADQ